MSLAWHAWMPACRWTKKWNLLYSDTSARSIGKCEVYICTFLIKCKLLVFLVQILIWFRGLQARLVAIKSVAVKHCLIYFCVHIGIWYLCAIQERERLNSRMNLDWSRPRLHCVDGSGTCRLNLLQRLCCFFAIPDRQFCDQALFSMHWKVPKWKGISQATPLRGNWQGALTKFSALSPAVRWSLLTSCSMFKCSWKSHQQFDSPVNAVIACQSALSHKSAWQLHICCLHRVAKMTRV